MKHSQFVIPKILLFLSTLLLLSACIKNDSTIAGDAKVIFSNYVSTGLSKDFYLDSVKYGSSVSYGSSTAYVVIPVNTYLPEGQTYKFSAKNFNTTLGLKGSLSQLIKIGKNYSVFYTKTKGTTPDSLLLFHEDDLKPDVNNTRLFFINLGYTLGSKVVIRDSLNTFTKTLDYGEMTDYIPVRFAGKNKIYVNLVDSANVVDTLKSNRFSTGKIVTIVLDGNKGGKLLERLIANN